MNELSVDVGSQPDAPLDFSLKKSPDSGTSSSSETAKPLTVPISQPIPMMTNKVIPPKVEPTAPKSASIPTALSGNLPSLMAGIFPASLQPLAAAAGFPVLGANTLPWMNHQANEQNTTKLKQSNKNMRPFKAYPKDPLSLPLPGLFGGVNPMLPFPTLDNTASNGLTNEQLFAKYREQILNSGNLLNTASITSPPLTPSMSSPGLISEAAIKGEQQNTAPSTPLSSGSSGADSLNNRKRPRTLPDDQKDEAYWERRRKNNEAAKRSRDARRAKEDEIAIRAAFLEQENLKLRYEIAGLKQETTRLRHALLNNNNSINSPSPPVAHTASDASPPSKLSPKGC